MNNATHHSRLSQYRLPQGAVPGGEAIRLRIASDAPSCSLMAGSGSGYLEFQMTPIDIGGIWMHEISIATPESGWLFYYFLIRNDDGIQYCCAPSDGLGGEGVLRDSPGETWQVTVYQKGFDTPDWAKGAVMYQIFPDRFYCGDFARAREGLIYHMGMGRKVFLHEDWNEEPLHLPLPGEKEYTPCDYFCGNLAGMRQKLSYIASLGVSILYLNPIFEAASNHRYNTADYHRIDPVLGDWDDFTALCADAQELGIRIILDGVFSHTGDDSIYFNRKGNFPTKGAYQGPDSPYYMWYKFGNGTDEYECWWNFPSLPETNENDPGFTDFILGEEGVISESMQKGAAGFRLDVADELPDPFISGIRQRLKQSKNDGFLIGEVWEDASKKYSYGERRRYLLGEGLDAVMNYPLREALLGFCIGSIDSFALHRRIMSLWENYPMPAFYSAMNLLSSHDVERIRTRLGGAPDMRTLSREEQARVTLTDSQLELADARMRLCTVLQYFLPGNPSIYYGDEAGMTGMGDPFNRRTHPWEKGEGNYLEWYQWLARLRQQNPVLKTGLFTALPLEKDIYAVIRFTSEGKDAFGRDGTGAAICIVNTGPNDRDVRVDVLGVMEGRHGEAISSITGRTFADTVTQKAFTFDGAEVILHMAPLSWRTFVQKEQPV